MMMKWYSIVILLFLTGLIIILVYKLSRKKTITVPVPEEESEDDDIEEEEFIPSNGEGFSEFLNARVLLLLLKTKEVYTATLIALNEDDRELLKKSSKEVKKINKLSKKLKVHLLKIVKSIDKELFETCSFAAQASEYLRETTYCLNFITNPSYSFINNVHNPLSDESQQVMKQISEKMKVLLLEIVKEIREKSLRAEDLASQIKSIVGFIETESRAEMVNIKDADVNTRTTMLYYSVMHETKNILLHLERFLISYEEFERSLPPQK